MNDKTLDNMADEQLLDKLADRKPEPVHPSEMVISLDDIYAILKSTADNIEQGNDYGE